jgi:hypothetical protein
MLTGKNFEFSDLHSGDVSSRGLMGSDAVYCCGRIPMFQKSMLFSSYHKTTRPHNSEHRYLGNETNFY